MSVTSNKKWSERLQWSPTLWGFTKITERFCSHIKRFQRDNGLKEDGVVGPITFRSWLGVHRQDWQGCVVIRGEPCKIEFVSSVKVVNPWDHVCSRNFEHLFTMDGNGFRVRDEVPSGIVIHNALTYDALGALKVFNKTKYIPHFLVSETGDTVYQLFDPVRYLTHHVGARHGRFNHSCIGIDNTNILEIEHINDRLNTHKTPGRFVLYKRKRAIERDFLQLPPKQVNVCWELVTFLCNTLGIKQEYPPITYKNGLPVFGDVANIPDKNLGVVAHGMIQKNRWDGFDFFYGLMS